MNHVEVFRERRYLFPGRRSQWYVRLKSSNGEILAVSEAYSSKWSAKRAARRNFPDLEIKVLE